MTDFSGHTVLVIGAAAGIGFGIGAAFHAAGGRVALGDVNTSGLGRAAERAARVGLMLVHWYSRLALVHPQGRISRALAFGVALVLATGCVTTWKYEKPGVDQTQTRRDVDLCREAARAPRVPRPFELSGGAVTSVPYENVDRKEFDACMRSKGYTRTCP